MRLNRRRFAGALAALPMLVRGAGATTAGPDRAAPVVIDWMRLILELVRHTPTYSPPVASRSFACLGIAAWEVVAATDLAAVSLVGQITDLPPLPAPEGEIDMAVALQAAYASGARAFFGNTGPSGQRAMAAMEARLAGRAGEGVAADVAAQSIAFGQAVATHVAAWADYDGGAVVENMGFPMAYTLTPGPAHWVPTNTLAQQQAPLLPLWGRNRPFAMPTQNACPLPPPPAYSEEPGSQFHAEAMEVYEVSQNLTPEQEAIARFWSDDPMLSPTPPGHWVSVVLEIGAERGMEGTALVDVLMRLGVAVADAFIGCWYSKYEFDLVRPVTYINRVIDPAWQPILITPPFPEYPSGHSTQSGAAEAVLAAYFGADFAFTDATHEDDGLDARPFPSFRAAAEEAALSRLYGGIHFRAAIERGLEQGRCIGAYAVGLKTWHDA